MSGYRNLHREQIESTAIWNVATSPLLTTKAKSAAAGYRIWTASADGLVRSCFVREKSLQDKQEESALDASALSMTCTHVLLGNSQSVSDATSSNTTLGCTRVSVTRNYAGEDDAAGDLVVASLELSGKVRIWSLPENEDDDLLAASELPEKPKEIKASKEFLVKNATGTVMTLCTPRLVGAGDFLVAVGCLDGTIAQLATGLMTPQIVETANNNNKEPKETGTLVDRWGSQGSSVPLSIASHPSAPVWAVGRQDGQLDILALTENTSNYRRHRLRLPGQDDAVPIRAITFTPDGNFLCAGNDAGMLAVWDVSRPKSPPTLAHHVLKAHSSWILDVTALGDSRRFVTCGADRKIHVWKVDQMYQALHTFDSDQTVWTLAITTVNSTLDASKAITRLAAGSETGWLQVLSVDS